MKTAMKRLLSFVLVAMMLVSVVPFQASADSYGSTVTIMPNYPLETGKFDSQINQEDGKGIYDLSMLSGEYVLVSGNANVSEGQQVSLDTVYYTNAVLASADMYANPYVATVDGTVFRAASASEVEDQVRAYYSARGITDASHVITFSGTNIITVSVALKEYEVQIVVDGVNGPKYDVQHGSSIPLNDAKITATTSYNNMELKPATQWTVTGASGTSMVNHGSSVTVTENLTATMNLVSTGYRAIELLNADGTHFGWAYEYNNRILSCPEPENYGDQQFLEWTPYNNTGASIEEGKNMAGLTIYDQYIAKWKTNINNGRSNLKVVAVYYADDHEKDRATVFTREMDNTATSILTGVLGVAYDQIKAEIEAQAPDYFGEVSWDGNYYNSSFSTKYTDTSLTLNGDKTIYVKINANDSAKAKVLLYVYKKVKETPDQILEMKGYLPHDDITLNDAITVAKKADWRAGSYKMYNDREWKQLLNVTNATVYTTEEIEAGEGTTVVHLLLVDGYKTGSNADTSNPKTGDTIMMAGGVLGLSAAALAVLYFLNKKKQVI